MFARGYSAMIWVIIIIFVFLVGSIATPGAVLAAEQAKITGDQISFNLDQENSERSIIAEGQAVASYQGYQIKGERVEYFYDSGQIMVNGQAVFSDQDTTISSREISGSLNQGELNFTGQVTLLREDLKISAETLSYNQDTDRIVFQGQTEQQPVLFYKEIEARADIITLVSEEEKAYLEGNTRGEGNGLRFAGGKLTVDLTDGKVILSGQAEVYSTGQGESTDGN